MLELNNDYTIYLPSDAGNISHTTLTVSGLGLSTAAYMKYGKGRLMIVGEAAMFSAQLVGEKMKKIGMNHIDAAQNAQFLLNIIHWLDKKLQ